MPAVTCGRLGVALYDSAAGARPFAGHTLYELSSAILGEQPRPLPPHVTPSFARSSIGVSLEDPAERFQRRTRASRTRRRSRRRASRRRCPPRPSQSRHASLPGRRSARMVAVAIAIAVVVAGVVLNVGGVRDRLLDIPNRCSIRLRCCHSRIYPATRSRRIWRGHPRAADKRFWRSSRDSRK